MGRSRLSVKAFWVPVISLLGVLFLFRSSDTLPDIPAADCRRITGTWKGSYEGSSCTGEREEGRLQFTIRKDCSLDLKRDGLLPEVNSFFIQSKSLRLQGDEIRASVNLRWFECGRIDLAGSLAGKSEIKGTYRYEKKGGGTFSLYKSEAGAKGRLSRILPEKCPAA